MTWKVSKHVSVSPCHENPFPWINFYMNKLKMDAVVCSLMTMTRYVFAYLLPSPHSTNVLDLAAGELEMH